MKKPFKQLTKRSMQRRLKNSLSDSQLEEFEVFRDNGITVTDSLKRVIFGSGKALG